MTGGTLSLGSLPLSFPPQCCCPTEGLEEGNLFNLWDVSSSKEFPDSEVGQERGNRCPGRTGSCLPWRVGSVSICRGDLRKVLSAHLGRGCIRLADGRQWMVPRRGTVGPSHLQEVVRHQHRALRTQLALPDTMPGPWAREVTTLLPRALNTSQP